MSANDPYARNTVSEDNLYTYWQDAERDLIVFSEVRARINEELARLHGTEAHVVADEIEGYVKDALDALAKYEEDAEERMRCDDAE